MFGLSRTIPTVERLAGLRFDGEEVDTTHDVIASEAAVALVYNGQPHVVMMASPADLEDFALGFSLSEGIVRNPREFLRVRTHHCPDGIEAAIEIAPARFRELQRRQRNLTGRVGCGLCGAQTLAQAVRHPAKVKGGVSIPAGAIQRGMAALSSRQPLNEATGAVHAAAWLNPDGDLALVREDIGRHNALDKLIGAMSSADTDVSTGAVLLTSRASYEVVQKAATVGIGIVCAISAPTTLAVHLAESSGVTLVAFARGQRHTVYSHGRRIEARVPEVAMSAAGPPQGARTVVRSTEVTQ